MLASTDMVAVKFTRACSERSAPPHAGAGRTDPDRRHHGEDLAPVPAIRRRVHAASLGRDAVEERVKGLDARAMRL